MTGRDADFSKATITKIASRAGHRCSFPGCGDATIGPGPNQNDVEKKGIAAHIFAASPKGPRGTGGLSVEDRKSVKNGIWLCDDHARLIDGEAGEHYHASDLQGWKAQHELRISSELKKIHGPAAGWLVSMEMADNPLLMPQSKISFGKVTLLVGENGSGKTALCEWLAGSAAYPKLLERWANTKSIRGELELLIPDRHKFNFKFDGNTLVCSFDGSPVTDLAQSLRVRYISEDARQSSKLTDVERLADVWSVHPYQINEILTDMTHSKYGFVRRAKIGTMEETSERVEGESEAGGADQTILAQIGDHEEPVPYSLLSGREQSQVIVSGAMALADRDSRDGPVLLVIDLGGQLLPDALLSAYAFRLGQPQFKFQTLLVSPVERPRVDWSGWSIARLVGSRPHIKIEQESIQ